MQSVPRFCPHIPPPPIPTRESIINEGLKIIEQSKIDEEWLKNWVDRKKEEKRLSSNRISLSDYRQKLIEHAHLLQQYEDALKHSNHDILSELKTKIEQSNNFIYDDNLIQYIQKQIHRRKSKRARLRRQKEHQLRNISQEPPTIEQPTTNEKPLKEKIQDINTILETIEQLKHVRQQRQKDNNIDNSMTNTDNELTDIEKLCTAQLLEYKQEMEKQCPSSRIELCNYLFNNQNQSFYESTNPDAQYFLQAHQNINNLAQVRQAWDQYLTRKVISSDNIIPSLWHEPQIPSDSNWAQYIFNKKE